MPSNSINRPQLQLTSGRRPAYDGHNVIVLPDLNGSYTFLAGHMENLGFTFPDINGENFVNHYRAEEQGIHGHLSMPNVLNELENWLSSPNLHQFDAQVKGVDFFNDFKTQLRQTTYDGKARKIILIGDTLHDRATNSFSMLLLFKHLKQTHVELEIIYSNHDYMAVKVYQALKQAYNAHKDQSFSTKEDAIKAVLIPVIHHLSRMLPPEYQYSMTNCLASLGKMMKESPTVAEVLAPIKQVMGLFEEDYFPYVSIVKAIDMQVDDGYGKYMFSHAPCAMVPALPDCNMDNPVPDLNAMLAYYSQIMSYAVKIKLPKAVNYTQRIQRDMDNAIGNLASESTRAAAQKTIKGIYDYLFKHVRMYENCSLTGLLDKLYTRAMNREASPSKRQVYLEKSRVLSAKQKTLAELLSHADPDVQTKKSIHELVQGLIEEVDALLKEARDAGQSENILLATCVSHFVQNRILVNGGMARNASKSIMNVHGHMGCPDHGVSYHNGINTTATPDIGAPSRASFQQEVFFGDTCNRARLDRVPGSPVLKSPSFFKAPDTDGAETRKRSANDSGSGHQGKKPNTNDENTPPQIWDHFNGPGSPVV